MSPNNVTRKIDRKCSKLKTLKMKNIRNRSTDTNQRQTNTKYLVGVLLLSVNPKKPKTRDRHRQGRTVTNLEGPSPEKNKERSVLSFQYVTMLRIFSPESAVGHEPIKWHIILFSVAFSPHIGICHFK